MRQAKDTLVRAFISERTTGWYAVSKWRGMNGAEGTTFVGPMSKADAEAVRDSMKQHEALPSPMYSEQRSH